MHVICTRRSRIDIIITRPRFPSLLVENTNRSIPRFLGQDVRCNAGVHVQFVASHGIATEGIRLVRTFNKYPSLLHLRQFCFLPPPPPRVSSWMAKSALHRYPSLFFALRGSGRRGGEKRFLLVAGAPYVTHFFPVITALDKGISRRRLIVDQR